MHLLVLQAVDERVQHGDDHGIEHRHHLVEVQRRNSTGPHIDEKEHPIGDGDGREVERAGGEGFVLPISRADPQDGGEDERVGGDNGQATDGQDSTDHNEIQQCVIPSVSAH